MGYFNSPPSISDSSATNSTNASSLTIGSSTSSSTSRIVEAIEGFGFHIFVRVRDRSHVFLRTLVLIVELLQIISFGIDYRYILRCYSILKFLDTAIGDPMHLYILQGFALIQYLTRLPRYRFGVFSP
jgi:hypothetical protein